MKRFFEIGDIVYDRKQGPHTQYEVIGVYSLEAEERYFKLKRISNFDPFDLFSNSERMYCTDFFRPIFWYLKREVIIEKIQN